MPTKIISCIVLSFSLSYIKSNILTSYGILSVLMEPDRLPLKMLIKGKWSVITTVSFGDQSKYKRNLRGEKSIAIASKSSCA